MLTHACGRKYGRSLVSPHATVLKIDRSNPFDLNTFAASSNHDYGEWVLHEEDAGSLALTEIDLSKIHLVDMLTESDNGHSTVTERIKRLTMSPYLRADAKIFETLWGQRDLMDAWRWDEGFSGHIGFEGSVYRRRTGDPNELGVINIIYVGGVKGWSWNIHRLKDDGCVCPGRPSVIIER
jgi:hypothetical protein